MDSSRSKLTYEDFLLFPDDGRRHELIDGEHYVTPSPNWRHQHLVVQLTFELELFLRAHRNIGRVFVAPFDCVVTTHDIVEPDLMVVLANQLNILTEKNIQGVPAILVEILSPGTSRRDRGIKRALYERAGVREYWIIDPDRDAIDVFERDDTGGFHGDATRTAKANHFLATPLLPGFSLSLAALFRR